LNNDNEQKISQSFFFFFLERKTWHGIYNYSFLLQNSSSTSCKYTVNHRNHLKIDFNFITVKKYKQLQFLLSKPDSFCSHSESIVSFYIFLPNNYHVFILLIAFPFTLFSLYHLTIIFCEAVAQDHSNNFRADIKQRNIYQIIIVDYIFRMKSNH
jgi:hypothetical protein